MDSSKTESEHFLGDYLFSELPSRLLVVGQLPELLLSNPPAGVEVHRLASLSDAEAMIMPPDTQVGSSNRVADSLVLQLSADSISLQQCLGRAVRAFPHRVLVHFHISESLTGPGDDAFFALGFRRLIVMPDNESLAHAVRWFEYRLSEYKAAPDWLNARFWANPERFDVDEQAQDYDDEFEDDDEEE